MHSKGIFKDRVMLSNGDFTEGFEIKFKNEEKETGWFELTEFFPIVKDAVKSGKFKPAVIVDDNEEKYELSVEECETIVRSYLDEVFGHIQGLEVKTQIELMKDKNIVDLLKVPLEKRQIEQLKKAGIV